jgi:DNA-binding response OmpR family regulator
MGEKVLVVDDEFEIRDLLSRFLTEEGYEVILASNGVRSNSGFKWRGSFRVNGKREPAGNSIGHMDARF